VSSGYILYYIDTYPSELQGRNIVQIWAKQLRYLGMAYKANTFYFHYALDGDEFTITLRHSVHPNLPSDSIKKIGFNLGMCYLIDMMEITLPEKVWVYKKLPTSGRAYWENLFEEEVIEKLYEYDLPTSRKYVTWEYGDQVADLRLAPFPSNRNKAAICLTGGKESLSIFKTLKGKKPLLLFFLNPEINVHRQRVYQTVKDDYPTVKTSSNRDTIFEKLLKRYPGFPGGVDMVHLLFNTMLYGDSCEYVLLGNEYSSNYPNTIYEGHVLNHQYIKTIHTCEQLNRYVHEFVTEGFSYYSPFFGMYELLISDLLFKDDEYLAVWTSCNRTTSTINFCSNCHKCAFSYLIGRLKRPESYLSRFFSRDMMQDVALYRPLMDFVGVKPFDCVGDKTEVWVGLELLKRKGVDNPVIRYYTEHIRPEIEKEIDKDIKQITSIQRVPIQVPEELQDIFYSALGVSAPPR